MNRTVLIVGLVIVAVLVAVFALNFHNDPAAIHSPMIGRPAPDFALKAVGTGQTYDLAQFRGKPVVLNFWATWCGPCAVEHPVLTETAVKLQGQATFLGVVFQDEESKILGFLNDRGGSSYPTLVDQAGKTAIAYGVGGVPETFFLNKNGVIVAKYVGPMSPNDIEANLQKAMQ